jgi:glucokinase
MPADALRSEDSRLVLGIDIGGTKLAVGLARPDGTIVAEARRSSDADDGPDAMIERVINLSRKVVADAGHAMDDVERIGIGCGGPLDPWRGVILNALNNPGWLNVPLVARVQSALGRPTILDNDANAAALGEHRFGAGRGIDDLVYLTISTGVGGGVIAGGRLVHGANGNAAELGHVSVDAHGRPCHCGSIGCLETYCSGTAIADRTRERLASGSDPSSLRDLAAADLRAEHVAEAAAAGDPLASAVWNGTMELLGAGIVSIIHAFNPRRVILGGGVTHAGDLLFDPVRRAVGARAMPWLREVVDVVPAALGDRSGILGAVAVALDRPIAGARREPSLAAGAADAGRPNA